MLVMALFFLLSQGHTPLLGAEKMMDKGMTGKEKMATEDTMKKETGMMEEKDTMKKEAGMMKEEDTMKKESEMMKEQDTMKKESEMMKE
jgi:hypothetical protein